MKEESESLGTHIQGNNGYEKDFMTMQGLRKDIAMLGANFQSEAERCVSAHFGLCL